jgi:hypothetical protein
MERGCDEVVSLIEPVLEVPLGKGRKCTFDIMLNSQRETFDFP